MHISLLFYSDTIAFLQAGPRQILGRAIANNDFLEALAKNKGSHHLSLFVSSDAELQYLSENCPYLKNNGVTLVPFCKARDYVQKKPVDVLHVLDNEVFKGLYFRDHVLKQNCAVTGITHTLGHDAWLKWMHMNALHRPQSFDRLICTSPTAISVLECMQESLPAALTAMPLEELPLGISKPDVLQTQGPINITGIDPEAFVFLYFGRLSPRSKVDLRPMIFLFKRLVQAAPKKLHLILAGARGNEDYPQELARIVSEEGLDQQVTIAPDVSDHDKKVVFARAQSFLAFSDNTQETFGLSILEAKAHGLAVVAANWNGYRNLIKDGEDGFLINTLAGEGQDIINRVAPVQLDLLNQLLLSQQVVIDLKHAEEICLKLVSDASCLQSVQDKAKEDAQNFYWPALLPRYLSLWEQLSQEAKQSAKHEAANVHLDFSKVFQSYPSQTFDPNLQVQTSARGDLALAGKANLEYYPGVEAYLDTKIIVGLLKSCAHKKNMTALFKEQVGVSEEDLRFQVLWLLKNDFLELV
ncbi:MAG: glycosyltransferase [Deltaproteobacteria bacterium]|nr:glycosyltransferase [Deltaproteobacteria bacterium]